MVHATADLREIVDAVEIQTADRFSVSGDTFEVPTGDGSVSATTTFLANMLYQRLYCRPSRGRSARWGDTRATRVFVDDLSQANCGTGTWEPGWVVKAMEDDGTLVVHKQRDDLTLWAQPQQFRPMDSAVGVGSAGRLRLGKELREMLPGYYTVLGDADQPVDDDGSQVDIVRFYWHLSAEISPVWIRELTRRFNAAGVSFRAKVQSDPSAYFRADAGVLYVARADLAGVMALIPDLHLTVSRHLRPTTPMFTKRLARGLAVAEDPGDGRSFGQHRCQLVADGLVLAFESGKSAFRDLTDAVAARFADEGLVVARPWLNAGSRQLYVWPTRRSRAGRSSGTSSGDMKRAQLELLDAATSIGRVLCATAYWHEGRCNWVGRSPREVTEPGMPITPTVTALGPELYAGTAGIALFLAQLSARVHLKEARATARAAMQQALWRSDDVAAGVRRGFYSGLVGIAYAAARVGMLTDDSDLIEDGLRLACRAVASPDDNNLLDVLGGNAGVITPLLRLARLPGGERLRDPTIALGEELATAATKLDGTWCWDNDRACGQGIGPTPLCGLAHGASGMGLALIEIGVQFRRRDLIDGGLAAFLYEDRLYDTDRENWPDLREFGSRHDDPRAPERSSFMVAWCHGAAGIGLARLRAVHLLPERRAELLVGVERAVRAAAQHLHALPADIDASPCHGRAGLAETLLYATEVLEDPKYSDQVVRMWKRLVRARSLDVPWPCGVASGRDNPSLMLGHAGVGYGLLRADDPQSIPSILVIEGCDRTSTAETW